jgi:hypothetical protein
MRPDEPDPSFPIAAVQLVRVLNLAGEKLS